METNSDVVEGSQVEEPLPSEKRSWLKTIPPPSIRPGEHSIRVVIVLTNSDIFLFFFFFFVSYFSSIFYNAVLSARKRRPSGIFIIARIILTWLLKIFLPFFLFLSRLINLLWYLVWDSCSTNINAFFQQRVPFDINSTQIWNLQWV